jgi:hypothetical protein
MKNGANQRDVHVRSGRWLRKARHRYILKVFPSILADHSLLWEIAKKMKERGLYAESSGLEHVRFSILRHINKMDSKKKGRDWWAWLLQRGWGQFGWREAA